MTLNKRDLYALTDYVDSLPDGTVIAASSSDEIPRHELVAAFRQDSHFDEDWIGLYGKGSASRVDPGLVAGLLRHVDPLAVTRIAFGAVESVHDGDAPRIEAGQTYIRRTHHDSFAVRVAESDMGTADGERLPLVFAARDPLADIEKVSGFVPDAQSGIPVRGIYLLLGDGSGRRVNIYSGEIVRHDEIEEAEEI